eukprot:TRINITY_DN92858_c0_g1_i1.p1 TRINITY_DN92858_c0_g1~~TRINITY_DN92858_c0_g1_i1.p1  ORF type:complete len:425 (-),score=49.30 TRINITY_DN92858_c0_g1_i1:137-1411(-)
MARHVQYRWLVYFVGSVWICAHLRPSSNAFARCMQGCCMAGQSSMVARARGRRGVDAANLHALRQGLIFAPGDEGTAWWDARNSASPVVLPPDDDQQHWQMWYYGRAATKWAKGVDAFLPTGRIGTAISSDGVSWKRQRGPLPQGACLDPSSDDDSFDCVHVGVGDVVRLPNGTLWMYYFGGGLDEAMPGRPGLRMQIGLAESLDGGKTWVRLNNGEPVLPNGASGSFDALFVAWPRVLPPWITAKVPGISSGKWYMSYHTAEFGEGGITWSAGAAFSNDGIIWDKAAGPVLTGGPDGAWDCKGIGVRSVAVKEDGRLAMLYEAVDASGDHAIGLAESEDGIQWAKKDVSGAESPGGPLLAKSSLQGAWDERVVGTPYVVAPLEGEQRWRLYYVGEAKEKPGLSIGLALSDDADLNSFTRFISA